jgi:hypothetical protein
MSADIRAMKAMVLPGRDADATSTADPAAEFEWTGATIASGDPSPVQALDARARRAARKVGLIARKSRWRAGTVDNYGGFMLIDPATNGAVDSIRFDLSAEYVIEHYGSGAHGDWPLSGTNVVDFDERTRGK